MNRKPFLVAILAVGGLVTAAEVRSTLTEQQQRVREFKNKAQEARKKEGLEGNRGALVSKYPTPEIGFLEEQVARPGEEVTLTATGHYVPESLVVIPCEGVEVLSSKVTRERVEARVRVRPGTPATKCDLQVVSPVSAISRSKAALRIKADSVWDLKLANGLTTRWKVEQAADGSTLLGQSEWFEKGKSLGTRPITITMSGTEAQATVGASEAEAQALNQSAEASAANMEAIGKKMDALMKKVDAECSKLAAEKQTACHEKYAPQMQALTQQMSGGPAPEAPSSPVCTELTLKAVAGKVTGTGSNCAGNSGVQVSGTFKPGTGK